MQPSLVSPSASPMRLSIANPTARIIESPDVVWIAAGLNDSEYQILAARQDSRTAELLCRQAGDASIIRVETTNGQPRIVTAWKGLTSCHEVFFQLAEGGEPMITDHFRNALAHVPPNQREPSTEALCDHFLFRTVPAGETLCRSVGRLGRGERLQMDPIGCHHQRDIFHRVEPDLRHGTESDYLERIDAALESTLAHWREHPQTVNLFSGGVDSSLIQTYLTDSVPAMCYELSQHADGFEAHYASHASGLLNLHLQARPASTGAYFTVLERLVTATAMPPPHVQLAFYQPLFESEYRTYVIGEQADALFGIGLRNLRLAAPFTSALGRTALRAAGGIPAGRMQRRVRRLHDLAGRLAQAPDSVDGYAARFGVYTELSAAERIFGRDLVRARLQARMDSVLRRFTPTATGDRFFQHVEAAQMVDFLSEDIMMCFRHLGHAHGKSIVAPFMTGALFDAALTIPPQDRYLRRLTCKYLLKALLARRLPGYPVHQPKCYSHVSFADLCGGGLTEAWQRYPVPGPLGDAADRQMLTQPNQLTWNALTLAIWLDRVRYNRLLAPVPGSRALAFS